MKESIKRRCKCGCGDITNYSNKWIKGHYIRTMKRTRYGAYLISEGHNKISRRCRCGCNEITTIGMKYIHGHNNKGKNHSAIHRQRIAMAIMESDIYKNPYGCFLIPEYRNELRKKQCKCGVTTQLHFHLGYGKLHVHHKDNNKENNHPSNFKTLCINCHAKKKKKNIRRR